MIDLKEVARHLNNYRKKKDVNPTTFKVRWVDDEHYWLCLKPHPSLKSWISLAMIDESGIEIPHWRVLIFSRKDLSIMGGGLDVKIIPLPYRDESYPVSPTVERIGIYPDEKDNPNFDLFISMRSDRYSRSWCIQTCDKVGNPMFAGNILYYHDGSRRFSLASSINANLGLNLDSLGRLKCYRG